MPVTTFGIVYASESKMIRRIIVPSIDDSELSPDLVGGGETLLIQAAGPHDVITCSAIVEQVTGVAPLDPRCAVVGSNGVVSQIIFADPSLDQAPEGSALVSCYSPQIAPGCTYDAAAALFSVPAVAAFTGRGNRQIPARDAYIIARPQ